MATKTTTKPTPGALASSAFGDVPFPAFDADAVLAAQQKNLAVLTAVNEIAVEGFRAVAKRQGEILSERLNDYAKASKAMFDAATPAEKAAAQAGFMNDGMTSAFGHARALSEMAAGTAGKAFDVIGKRFAESLDEVDAMAKGTGAAR